MRLPRFFIPILGFALTACANPLNQATAERYAEQCGRAERSSDLETAEVLCSRAMTNVDWGNLGPEMKSRTQYNLARVKKQMGKFGEAEELLRESLKLEEALPGPSNIRIGRRLAELAMNLAAQDRWSDGMPVVERLSSIRADYAAGERRALSEIYRRYGEQARGVGKAELAATFDARAMETGP